MFILVHDKYEKKRFCVNIDKITAVADTPDGATIMFKKDFGIVTNESYNQVLILMQTVLQQGRFRGIE